MKNTQIQQTILDILSKIAPEIDPATVDMGYSIQEEFEIDSMDFLRVVTAVDEIFGIAIPESDYANISTMNDMVAYIEGKIPV